MEARVYCSNLTETFDSFHLSFDLPSIHSPEENDLLFSKLSPNMGFHLGLKRKAGDSNFIWTDESHMDYTRWWDNNPHVKVR